MTRYKVIAVSWIGNTVTNGKIYEVVDGWFTKDNGEKLRYILFQHLFRSATPLEELL
jgi:hypothetical protein